MTIPTVKHWIRNGHLGAFPVTRATLILAITAYLEGNARERILEAGADSFRQKPFRVVDFQVEVVRLLETLSDARARRQRSGPIAALQEIER